MQLAITKYWIFDPHGATPKATVFITNVKGTKHKSFEVVWNGECERWWKEDLKPIGLIFYNRKLLPAIKKYLEVPLVLPTPEETSKSRLSPQPLSSVGAVGKNLPGTPSSASNVQNTRATSSITADQTPSVKVGKRVWDRKRGCGGLVVELSPCGKRARVVLEGVPSGKKFRALDDLQIIPYAASTCPQYAGQTVIINGGYAEEIGKVGQVQKFGASKCVVKVNERLIRVSTKALHCLDEADKPTMQAAKDALRIHPKDLGKTMEEYLTEKGVHYIGHPSQEAILRAVEKFKKEYSIE